VPVNVHGIVTRRVLLAGSAALLGARGLKAAKARITKARISAITDEIGPTQTGAIAFAKQFALQWVELRTVPESKKEFAFLSEPELKRYSAELAANKLKVSLLKTSLLKFPWPDLASDDPDLEANKKRWDRRKDDLARVLTAARILGVDRIGIFTGTRVANPASAYPAIVKAMEELTPLAEGAKVRLLIENDPSQNIGTCAELKAIMDLLPSNSIGSDWDPYSAIALNEVPAPWPGGYALLHKARIGNVRINSAGLADGPQQINWRALLDAMERDGYQGEISLATEPFDGTLEKTNDAMREIMHIVGQLA
jgi:sugar phosphate isomerase/epimerase